MPPSCWGISPIKRWVAGRKPDDKKSGAPKGAASGSPQRRFLCRHGPNPAERIVDALLDVAERLARAAERLADLGGVLLPVAEPKIMEELMMQFFLVSSTCLLLIKKIPYSDKIICAM